MGNLIKKYGYLLIMFIFILFLYLFSHLFSVTRIKGNSMFPTLKDNQIIVVNKEYKNIKRNDIVIATSFHNSNAQIIKRIIGIPGDKILIKNKTVYVNNNALYEPYVNWVKENLYDTKLHTPITIPENKYFLLGDNRDISYDSRIGGLKNKSSILGKVILIK